MIFMAPRWQYNSGWAVEFEEQRLASVESAKALGAGRFPEVDFVRLFGGQVGEPVVIGDGYEEAHIDVRHSTQRCGNCT
jgi:hypothetical protein